MAKRTNPIQLIFALTLFFLCCGGLQSVHSHQLPENSSHSPGIRVDRCHPIATQIQPEPCCKLETCHQTTPRERDFGGPGYHTRYNDSYSLIHESRSLAPQLKLGTPFVHNFSTVLHLSSLKATSQTPRQSLRSLRTTVLLN